MKQVTTATVTLEWLRAFGGVLLLVLLMSSCKKPDCFTCLSYSKNIGGWKYMGQEERCGDKATILHNAQQVQLNNPSMKEICYQVK